MTALPVLLFGLLEVHVEPETLMEDPTLYKYATL